MLAYNSKAGCLATALSYRNTVIPLVLGHAEFWVFLVLHLAIYVLFQRGAFSVKDLPIDPELDMSWKSVEVITTITTLVEVFYSNQCYARYMSLYKMTKGLVSDAQGFTFSVRAFVGTSRNHVRVAVRYMAAAVLLNFYQMKGEVTERDWAELVRLAMLQEHEVRELRVLSRKYPPALFIAVWASEVTDLGAIKANSPANSRGMMTTMLLKIRESQQDIVDNLELPVPFQYFHLLSIMITMNLMLFSYTMGLNCSIFSPVMFFCSALLFIGMMELSSALSDPFGDDDVDFPMDQWLSECIESVVELVEHEYPGGVEGLHKAIENEVTSLPRGPWDLSVIHLGGG